MKISFVVWDGFIGGAERFAVSLAGELVRRGVKAGVVVVGPGDQLRAQLEREDVPAIHLGLSRGSLVMRHPRLLRQAVERDGAGVAILDGFGYLGTVLRLAGFRGSIIGVEHGVLIHTETLKPTRRLVRRLDRASGVFAHDAEVAVSAFMEQLARRAPHGRRLVRIPHGVRMDRPLPSAPRISANELRIGYAGRLFPGKGLEVLLHALALVARGRDGLSATLAIAGEGPTRPELEKLADTLGVRDRVSFVGWVEDIAEFWSQCHLAVTPNDHLAESFSMSTVEAMACARPTIVSARGALPELVRIGITGAVVPAGDANALASAISGYAQAPDLVPLHGEAAHAFAQGNFRLDRCADRYLDLVHEVALARNAG
jgi:glycosyltransferase involved in cell wall biosynthesis